MTEPIADAAEHAEPADAQPPFDPVPAPPLTAAVEAILLSTDKPLPPARIAEGLAASGLFAEVTAVDVESAAEELNETYLSTFRSFSIERLAGGLRILAKPEFAAVLAAFHKLRAGARFSRPALETLAIIAYRQPITRAQLEAIRGVACGEVLKGLLERRLVTVTGRAEELGRPMLYGTTKRFLEVFGLPSIKELPPPEALGLGS